MSSFKNYLFSLSIQFMNILAPLITLPLVVKALGTDGMGKIALVSSILSYFLILGSSGLTSFGNKIIARSNEKEHLIQSFNKVLNLQILYVTISLFAFVIYIFFLGFNLKSFLLILILQLISTYFDFTWFFYGINKIKVLAIRNFFIRLLGILLIYFFVNTPNDISKYLWILGISNLLANISVILVIKEYIGLDRIRFGFGFEKDDLLSSLYIILPMFIMAIYSNIDRIIIFSYSKNFGSVGLYDVGMKFISICAVLIVSLRPIMISKISNNFGNVNKIEELVFKSISLVLYISIPICFLLFIEIETFIRLFLGEKFIESAFIVRILTIQILFTGIGDIFVNQILISIGQEKKVFIIISVLCLLMIGLFVILIPIFGIHGAALTSVLAHFLILVLEFYYVNMYIKIRINYFEIIKILFSGLLCGSSVYVMKTYFLVNSYAGLISISLVGIIVYLFCGYIFNLQFQKLILKNIFKIK